MLKKILFAVLMISLISCEADIPELTMDASAEGYGKTGNWPLSNGDLRPVNPIGLNVSTPMEDSYGVVKMELSGDVDCGIPPALQEIVDSGANPNIKVQTDYPYHHTNWSNSAEDKYYYTDDTSGKHDKPLENMISLKALSKNSQYAAVTLTFPNIGSGITVDETNDSLMLLANNYCTNNGANATYSFNADNMAWRRITNYIPTANPNYFAYYSGYDSSGISNQIEYSIPGPGSYNLDRGGMSFLIWNGRQKNATVKVNNKTIKFDWSGVSFKSVPLQYAAWYPLPISTPGISCIVKSPTPLPDGNNPQSEFHYTLTVPSGTPWVDNFITPSFYPENSTEKKVTNTTDPIPTDPLDPEKGDSYIKVSLADRIRLDFNNAAPGDYSEIPIATINTSNESYPTITLYLTVTVTSP